jgi:hypothetical protein
MLSLLTFPPIVVTLAFFEHRLQLGDVRVTVVIHAFHARLPALNASDILTVNYETPLREFHNSRLIIPTCIKTTRE